ncbi:MAG TPA: ribonuclease E inhibitor RraB [Thermoanaerobaculia bacterium]|nr:ribonuclease E inhibitor RraB [Thermoanaerobaculia bacterium]
MSTLQEHLARNVELLEMIRENGGDESTEGPVDFFFIARSETGANALEAELTAGGFDVVMAGDGEEEEGLWSVQAGRFGTVGEVTSEPFVERMVSLATKHDADFDGWGMAI